MAANEEELKAEMAKHLKAVPYLPAENIKDHGLMRAFIFHEPKTAPCQTGEKEKVWNRVASAREAFERLQGFKAEEHWEDFAANGNVKKHTSANVKVAINGTEFAKGDATLEMKNDVEFGIGNVTRHILDDSEDPLGLAGFLEKFACQYVQADWDVKSRILKDGIENGRGDVIIGFESAYLTGTLSDMSHSSKNKATLHGSGGGVGGEIGVSHEVTGSSKSGQVEGRKHSVVGSVFKVVHVQRRVLGTGEHRIRKIGGPFTLQDLGNKMLQDMFREAFPSLVRRTKKTVQRVVGGIFWKNASDRADQLVNTAAGQAGDDEEIVVFGSTGEPLFRDQAVDFILNDSWNYFFKLKKKTFVKMLRELEEDGKTTYRNAEFTHLSVVRDCDLSDYIPIYFNWEAHKYDASKVPSRVVCYKTSQAGEWCLRPVEGGKGKMIVTIYDEKWQVRESIVQVSNDDTHLQEELSKIGFHFVEEGQKDLEAIKGSTMMGRHELTPKDCLGTTISNSVLEFRGGVLCTMGSDMAEAGATDRPSTLVTTSAAEIPPAPLVTNPMSPTPTRPGKKAKTDH